ncbi:MAG: hypothetical protein JRI55_08695 [Deltaproteobacteria bacterium]|nr:hypothetical protein [Deltaproteobacteria bacterium]
MSRCVLSFPLLLAVACAQPDPELPPSPCGYPEGVGEPMALGGVIAPYAWQDARHADGRMQPLNLQDAPCNADPALDWEPYPVALLVSIPAW